MSVTIRLFAVLRERMGRSELQLDPGPGETAASMLRRIFPDEDAAEWMPSLRFAVNQEFVEPDHPLADGDELALIPPLGGGSSKPRATLSHDPLELAPLLRQVEGPGRGGVCSFTGAVRDHFEGRPVTSLAYEAHEEMALKEMDRLCQEIEDRWPGTRVAMAHRLGNLEVGEAAVHVVTAGAHRAEAFEACRHGIDELKARVPIFKKEIYQDGGAWKGNAEDRHGR